MITDEKAEEWAKRIVYFDWNGDKGDYSSFLKHWHGRERMYQDVVSDNIEEEDLEKIYSALEIVVSERWQEPYDKILQDFKTIMKSTHGMGVFKYGNTTRAN